jgi:hypothetical protein
LPLLSLISKLSLSEVCMSLLDKLIAGRDRLVARQFGRNMAELGVTVVLLGPEDAAVLVNRPHSPLIYLGQPKTPVGILNAIYACALTRLTMDITGSMTVREAVGDAALAICPDKAKGLDDIFQANEDKFALKVKYGPKDNQGTAA